MGMNLKSRKEAIIQKPEEPDPNTSKYDKYIWKIECKKYIAWRENLNQGLKPLLPLFLGSTLKSKIHNRSNFTKIKDEGSVLNLTSDIEEEGYGLY